VAVHGGSGVRHGLIEQVRGRVPSRATSSWCTALDRDTSGVLLLAKKRSALRRLHDELRDGATDKHYLALVDGGWRDDRRTVRAASAQARRAGRAATAGARRRPRVSPARRRSPAAALAAGLAAGRASC
jgi:23S rRNA pseudouridine955/2504/2580 synthase